MAQIRFLHIPTRTVGLREGKMKHYNDMFGCFDTDYESDTQMDRMAIVPTVLALLKLKTKITV